MTTPADIFEALAALPNRTPAQRAADERSAAILRDSEELQERWDDQSWTLRMVRSAS